MIYRNIYFKECNHVKVVFEKNAEFNVLSNCDFVELWFDLEFPIYSFSWEHLTTGVVKWIVKFVIQLAFN